MLTINADGTYAFHSDAHDGVQAHAGSFAASNGAWTMKAKTGYAGSGNYLYQAPSIFVATSQLGAVVVAAPGTGPGGVALRGRAAEADKSSYARCQSDRRLAASGQDGKLGVGDSGQRHLQIS